MASVEGKKGGTLNAASGAALGGPLAAVCRRYGEGLIAQVPEVLDALARLDDVAAREQLRDIAHKLHGSAGTFGFSAISDTAAALEEALDAGQPPMVIRTYGARLIRMMRSVQTRRDAQ